MTVAACSCGTSAETAEQVFHQSETLVLIGGPR